MQLSALLYRKRKGAGCLFCDSVPYILNEVIAFVSTAMQALRVKKDSEKCTAAFDLQPPILKSDWLLDSSRLLKSKHGT